MISHILIVLSDTKEILNSDSDEENKLLYLTKIGYSEAKASIAMERCGLNSSITELTDFICAAQMAKAADTLLSRKLEKKLLNEDGHAFHLPNPMIGFGVLTKSDQITQRTLPEDAIGPPYFYYENVTLAPVDVWTGISQNGAFLGSKNKVELFTNMYRKCQIDRKDLNKVAPLEPDEVEMLLGFPKNHTRGGGSARDMFPGGINVLSLFSRISDAEVAFYCLGIPLKTNVQELNDDQLEQLMSRFVKFDLVVGGIPCNNLFLISC
ncbi:DNA (Cytosine-5)-methyltransferase DRM1/2 isoform 4 [Hibiscus syriacus]|uniref:DNA (Cytosine-5)-methyltransferase DRM1/2 isoform 4 n=1 Tax=Hibiscus syriacus TaxID=106335 RepID=A0A6A3ACE8_HIBSY|nr:DNA (Cytosine-5)-methyltransferase DRM1/2 isoform 4 [Hibiscus syriacus]